MARATALATANSECFGHAAAQPQREYLGRRSAEEPCAIHWKMCVAAREWWKFTEMPAQFLADRRLHRGIERREIVEDHLIADHIVRRGSRRHHDMLRKITDDRPDT